MQSSQCVTTTVFSQFFKGGSTIGVLMWPDCLTGFLPCGLVYSFP
jgi:sulfite exporter TauE/SafE